METLYDIIRAYLQSVGHKYVSIVNLTNFRRIFFVLQDAAQMSIVGYAIVEDRKMKRKHV